MAALRHLNVRGMRVEIWETCFRIEGMSQPLSCGPHLNDQQVKQIIETIFDHVRSAAEQNAKQRVLNRVNKFVEEAVNGAPVKRGIFG